MSSGQGVTREEKWVCAPSDIILEGSTVTATQKKASNIYGEATVAAGRAEWDIKLEFEGFGGVTVGLWRQNLRDKNNLEQLPKDNEAFVNFENGYGFTNKTGEFIHNKERKAYSPAPWKRGSILTVHLDLTSRTLTYSIDGKPVGLAKDCLPRGAYRIAAKLQFKEQKISILRFWTSLEDDGVPQIPNLTTRTASTESVEKEKTDAQPQTNNLSNELENTETKKKENDASADSGFADEIDELLDEEEQNNNDQTTEANTPPTLNHSSTASKSVEATADGSKMQKHSKTYSLTEMRDQILQQKSNSNLWKAGSLSHLPMHEEVTAVSPGAMAVTSPVVVRARSASGTNSMPPLSIPERVEVEEKDDDSTDTFVIAGNNLTCEIDMVICTKEAKGVRNSAFGAQVVTHGRMDWKLQIEQGHSIRIGVCAITHGTGEDYTDSPYGYGYGDDGNIYCHRSLIEWGEGYQSGDIVGVHLDMEKRILRFTVNGNDHGVAFDNLQIKEDEGIDGYRLAVSLQYRPHQVKLLESTLYNTKQYSPRPSFGSANPHTRGPSWFTHAKTPSDDLKQLLMEETEAPAAAENKEEDEKKSAIESTEASRGNNKIKNTSKGTTTQPTNTKGKNPKKTPKKEKGKTSTVSSSSKEKPATKNPTSTKTNGATKTKPKVNGKLTVSGSSSKLTTTRVASAINKATKANIKPRPLRNPIPNKTISPATNLQWKAPRTVEDQFVYSGTQLRIDNSSCLAKNSIQDGNSAFGVLEVTKDTKVEWTIKVAQGTQVAIGVMQTDDSIKKNNIKYRKLLNNIFCTDRLGYGYFGKDGGVMKGGKYRKYGAAYKAGDTVTVVLNMAANQLEFSKGDKYQGVAFSNIPTGCYRLAVMLPKKMHKVVIEKVQLWELDK